MQTSWCGIKIGQKAGRRLAIKLEISVSQSYLCLTCTNFKIWQACHKFWKSVLVEDIYA